MHLVGFIIKKSGFFLSFSYYTSSYLIVAGVEFYLTLDYTQCDTTLGRAALHEGSARCKDLYMTTPKLTTDRHPGSGRIQTRKPSKRAAADERLRKRGHWVRWKAQSTTSEQYYVYVLNGE